MQRAQVSVSFIDISDPLRAPSVVHTFRLARAILHYLEDLIKRPDLLPLFVAQLLALPSRGAAQVTATFLDYRAPVPAGWVTAPATSSMRLAQYTIPASDGTVGAEVIVYFFGTGQGGNVDANLSRWKAQFSNPDGSTVYERVTRDSSGAFPVTIAEYRGTYARGIGAGDAAAAKPGQSLIAAIAETPRGTLFFQLFGATSQVTAQRGPLTGFVKAFASASSDHPPEKIP